jgi:hypothetical protein
LSPAENRSRKAPDFSRISPIKISVLIFIDCAGSTVVSYVNPEKKSRLDLPRYFNDTDLWLEEVQPHYRAEF